MRGAGSNQTPYTDIANLRANLVAGYFYANRFYTEDSTSYFIDGNSVSYFHEIRIDDLLRDKGDTNTYIYFLGDRIQLVAGGVEMLDIVEGGTDYIDLLDNDMRMTLGLPGLEMDADTSVSATIQAGYNLMTAGPNTIASGITVTVSTGATWTIV